MNIKDPCIITLTWSMKDSMHQDISQQEEPTEYFYGGSHELLPKIEEALLGHSKGDQLDLYLEPEYAFGEYNSELVFFEERSSFQDGLEEGMQINGLPKNSKNNAPNDTIFNVTEIYDEHVVVDGNHPLAGISLRLHIDIVDVREATPEEIANAGTVHMLPLQFKLSD